MFCIFPETPEKRFHNNFKTNIKYENNGLY